MANPATPQQRFAAYKRNRPRDARSNFEQELVKIVNLLQARLTFSEQVLAALRELRELRAQERK